LTYNDKDLDESVFIDLAMTRPTLSILPNLRNLTWAASTDKALTQCLLFLHPGLTSLNILVRESVLAAPVNNFLQEVQTRTPYLSRFELNCTQPMSEVETSLMELLRTLEGLEEITLPHYYLTSNLLEHLSTLGRLKNVLLWSNSPVGDPKDVKDVSISPAQGSFPLLEKLSVDMNLTEGLRFVQSKASLSHLTYIHISALKLEAPSDIHNFLKGVSESCPALTTLVLSLLVKWVEEPSHSTSVTMDTLRPVLACSKLVEFDITYNYPFRLTQADLAELARNWPSLQSLFLCEYPYVTHDRSDALPTLAALIPFAEHCPNLTGLGLFLDATIDEETSPLPSVITPFRNLALLNVGQSFISNPEAVAMFIAQICPQKGLDLNMVHDASPHSFSPYLETIPDPPFDELLQKRMDTWREAKKLIPAFQTVQRKEKERTDLLEERLRIAEAQVAALRRELAASPTSTLTLDDIEPTPKFFDSV
jgi:hypothetical protein